jgi:hypothetical protein
MDEFDGLDLQAVEDKLDAESEDAPPASDRVVLDVLDGTTPPEEWIQLVASGAVLVLHVDGDLNELAAGFARGIRDGGGNLMHFRGFLVVTPADVDIDADRLG